MKTSPRALRLFNPEASALLNCFHRNGIRAILLVLLCGAPLRGSVSQGPAGDELFQLVTQIEKLEKENNERAALPLVERALVMAREIPEKDARHIAVLSTAGSIYLKTGDKQKAEALMQRACDLASAALEASHPLVFATLVNLALFYREQEDGARSGPLFARTVALMEKIRGPEHRDVAVYLKLWAESYFQQGDYVAARPIYERTVALLEKLGETEDQLYMATLNDLAEVYSQTGDYIRAATMLSKDIDLKKKVLGPDHPSVGTSLSNLATLARRTHNYGQAAVFYQRAADIFDKAYGPESLQIADLLNQVGLLASDTGDNARAELLFKRALQIREAKGGKEDSDLANPLTNLAWIQFARGNYSEAEALYLRALEIHQRTEEANHPNVATMFTHLAMLYEAKGDFSKAVAMQRRSNEIAEHNLTLTLSQGSEEQKLLYMSTLAAETNGTISLHMRSAPNNIVAAQLAATTILQRKGRLLDVLSDSVGLLRRRLAPGDAALLDQLTNARTRLATLSLNSNQTGAAETRKQLITELQREIAQLETEISSHSADFRLLTKPVSVVQVQAALPRGAWLLEFVVYQPFDVAAGDNNAWKPSRYAVYLISRDDALKWVDLGEVAPMDAEISRFRSALQDPERNDVRSIARSLDERLMKPVRQLIGDSRRLFIAPDGALNLIPFAALIDGSGKYLIDTYSISYLTSGRDLLRLEVPASGVTAPLIVANPQYDLQLPMVHSKIKGTKSGTQSGGNTTNRRSVDFTALTYSPLPFTLEEADRISSLLGEARLLVEADATEAAVKHTQSPRILHIATHGFFLPNQIENTPSEDGRRKLTREKTDSQLENPLLRSGLVLAGVKQGSSGSGEDGVLTALEVAGLNLAGTKLVVFSACETGLGEIINGDGVYGLRRALVMAGSETQVISLWQVSDTATRDLMTGYYRRLKAGEGRAEAFRQVQLEMLHSTNHSHPYFWASFIQSGAWTSLDSR